ncbi:hypothetical protein NAEGRDRAFT_78026 [Naegleria gruberi]|uniref:Ras family small GTPase n=1 Tax=Naegleria gruberi TaxID=5762 RepID=D2V0C7_NAEGR|nr:uncharacterized protein NAEGRDRAFT_78026 [Naegleria gruberi]EFC49695.1 hypothetical protein NAEGRDRAFT_78026 [Naegleria gruberi]|eukprot:XP_002682439.1 hypothetical protein NAEGRDRAFT_78026 [Naegleria gruberi strain NEG-M]
MKEQYMKYRQAFVVVSSIDNFIMQELIFNIELIVKAKNAVVNDFPVMFALNKIDFSNSDPTYRNQVDEYKKKLGQLIKTYDLSNSEIFETNATSNSSLRAMFEQLGRRHYLGSYSISEILKLVLKDDAKVLQVSNKNEKCSMM